MQKTTQKQWKYDRVVTIVVRFFIMKIKQNLRKAGRNILGTILNFFSHFFKRSKKINNTYKKWPSRKRWQCPNCTLQILTFSNMRKKSFSIETANKKISLKKQKHFYPIYTWSEKAFKGSVVYQTLLSFHGGSLETILVQSL